MDHLTALFQEMWRRGEVPQGFKDSTIVHIYKRKGSRQLFDNHRGICLLNTTGKSFAHIPLNDLNHHLEYGLLPENQCSFRRRRGTTDMIFAARQLQMCQKMQIHLYSTFVELTKALDILDREGLRKIMQKFGCPERFTHMVRQLHDGMMALMFSVMLMDADRGGRPGIRIAHRTDSQLLNHRWMHFQSRVSAAAVHKLLFADDSALNATSEGDMQGGMGLFAVACDSFGLIINTEKMVVRHQPPPDADYVAAQINVNGAKLQLVDKFTYLDSTLPRTTEIDYEVALRISKASQAFARLQNTGIATVSTSTLN
nr:unnamed protein product [Spirometra erinaceieuropaei]